MGMDCGMLARLCALAPQPAPWATLVGAHGRVGSDRSGGLRALPRGGEHQLPVALWQVAHHPQHHAPQDQRGKHHLQCRRQGDRQILRREPHTGALRQHQPRVLHRAHRHRGRTLLPPSRHRLWRCAGSLQGHGGARPAARRLHHHAATGEEHVPHPQRLLHRAFGLHPGGENAHHEEQGVGAGHRNRNLLQQTRNPGDVCQHGGVWQQCLRHQDGGAHLLRRHSGTTQVAGERSPRGATQGHHGLQSAVEPQERTEPTQCGAEQHGVVRTPEPGSARLGGSTAHRTALLGGVATRRRSTLLPPGGGTRTRGVVPTGTPRPQHRRAAHLHHPRHAHAAICRASREGENAHRATKLRPALGRRGLLAQRRRATHRQLPRGEGAKHRGLPPTGGTLSQRPGLGDLLHEPAPPRAPVQLRHRHALPRNEFDGLAALHAPLHARRLHRHGAHHGAHQGLGGRCGLRHMEV